ncbi:MAG: glycosyltransferase family 2 protein [bacterium]
MNQSNSTRLRYVLITPARNEEAFIRFTIESVISQTVLPECWVIVSDGSTDRTDDIVKEYLPKYRWIELLRLPEKRDRSFAGKVTCFEAGRLRASNVPHEILGNLDGDVSFEPDYMEFLIEKFESIPNLGVAGTPFVEDGYSSIADSFEGGNHVAGGCQLFRKECFDEIGGYVPNKEGGIDWIAVTTARMKGWKTMSFKEKTFFHHRPLGTGGAPGIRALYHYGRKDYYLGNHPIWEILRFLYRLSKRPYVVGALVLLGGYLWAAATRMERPISPELMRFHRREEMEKLKMILVSLMKLKRFDKYAGQ